MSETAIDYDTIRALQDRTDIEEVLYTYSSAVDSFDKAGVRGCLADDIHATYGNAEPVTDADTLANWIADATATCIWQHHLLNVYHVRIDGDQANTVSYLTSYQVFEEDPKSAVILVARYHDVLRRTADGWKISERVMELLWGETKPDTGFLDGLGGRGPKVWARS
ncbi:nuclear transport factor 2 family protein [Solirubrobacter soli]|uniref:nuclear transport factor 2 family protein n=1 Tax=Solirubrobacter soli TaxID=363832 RepID=UPI000419E031|nr:nuclear transport factor 2 family protein [Solirubrobacter soli]